MRRSITIQLLVVIFNRISFPLLYLHTDTFRRFDYKSIAIPLLRAIPNHVAFVLFYPHTDTFRRFDCLVAQGKVGAYDRGPAQLVQAPALVSMPGQPSSASIVYMKKIACRQAH